jgi:hypothetical protein
MHNKHHMQLPQLSTSTTFDIRYHIGLDLVPLAFVGLLLLPLPLDRLPLDRLPLDRLPLDRLMFDLQTQQASYANIYTVNVWHK